MSSLHELVDIVLANIMGDVWSVSSMVEAHGLLKVPPLYFTNSVAYTVWTLIFAVLNFRGFAVRQSSTKV